MEFHIVGCQSSKAFSINELKANLQSAEDLLIKAKAIVIR
jgi:hypothetical protein